MAREGPFVARNGELELAHPRERIALIEPALRTVDARERIHGFLPTTRAIERNSLPHRIAKPFGRACEVAALEREPTFLIRRHECIAPFVRRSALRRAEREDERNRACPTNRPAASEPQCAQHDDRY